MLINNYLSGMFYLFLFYILFSVTIVKLNIKIPEKQDKARYTMIRLLLLIICFALTMLSYYIMHNNLFDTHGRYMITGILAGLEARILVLFFAGR